MNTSLISTQTLIREFLNDNESTANVNISLKKVENIFIATVKRCLKIKTIKKHKRVQLSTNKKWFDKECRLKRHELRKLANQKHRDPLNVILREEYHTVLKLQEDDTGKQMFSQTTIQKKIVCLGKIFIPQLPKKYWSAPKMDKIQPLIQYILNFLNTIKISQNIFVFNSFTIYAILLNKDFNFLKRFDTGEQRKHCVQNVI